MSEPKTIDHDPHEFPLRVRAVISALTIIFVLAVTVPFAFGVNLFVRNIPFSAVALMDGLLFGICFGAFLGRWLTLGELGRTEDAPLLWRMERPDWEALFKYIGYLLAMSPFAVFIVPFKAWQKARADGDDIFLCIQHGIGAAVFGLMISLLAWMAVGISLEIAFGV